MKDRFKRHDPHTMPEAHVALGPHDRPAGLPQVDLEIVRGQAKNKRRPVLVPAFLIGSASDCDLVLGDRQFPDVYAYLLLKPTGVFLRYLGFAPKMMVNGRPISQIALSDGDRICMEPYEFQIHIWNHTDDDWTEGIGEALSATEVNEDYDDGYEEVMRLLGDVRAAVFHDTHALRLYVESDVSSHRTSTTPAWFAARLAAVPWAWGA